MSRNSRSCRRGFTLTELTIALAIFAVGVLSTLGVLGSVADGYETDVRASGIAENARRGIDRLSEDLRAGEGATVVLGPWLPDLGGRILFNKMVGFRGQAPVFCAIEYRLEPSPLDADGDGRANDYRLVRIDSGGPTTLCHHVAEGGLSLTRTGDEVHIRLTTKIDMPDGAPVRRCVETTVTLRN